MIDTVKGWLTDAWVLRYGLVGQALGMPGFGLFLSDRVPVFRIG